MLAIAQGAVCVTCSHDQCSPEPITCHADHRTCDVIATKCSEEANNSCQSLTMFRKAFTRTAGVVQRHSIPGIPQVDIHCFFLHKRPAIQEPMLSSLEAHAPSDLAWILLQPAFMQKLVFLHKVSLPDSVCVSYAGCQVNVTMRPLLRLNKVQQIFFFILFLDVFWHLALWQCFISRL